MNNRLKDRTGFLDWSAVVGLLPGGNGRLTGAWNEVLCGVFGGLFVFEGNQTLADLQMYFSTFARSQKIPSSFHYPQICVFCFDR